jgi:heat shock protein HtpX
MGSHAPKVDFGHDRGLQARMLLTMALLALVYGAFAFVMLSAGTEAIVIFGLVTAVALGQILLSTRSALAGVDGREVSPAEAPALHAVVDRLCIQADLPKPRVAVAQADYPNAFAIGHTPSKALVCVTSDLLARLDERELEAVIAHELAHVRNRDVLVMTIASFVAMIALLMTKLVNLSFRLFFAFALAGVVFYGLGRLLLLALSRHREFAADRGAALMTGRPSALASALVKVAGGVQAVPSTDLRAARQLNAFFVVSSEGPGVLARVLGTHPPLRKRIEALSEMEQSMHGGWFDSRLLADATDLDSGVHVAAPIAAPAQATALAPAASVAPAAPAAPVPGWYADPWQATSWRWWDGAAWTAHTAP